LGGGDAGAARHRRRRRGPTVRHAPQRPGHHPVPAHRPGAAPETPAGRRHREVYRDRPRLPNRGHDARHNPEFTMMELYQAYGDYHTMMALTEGLIVACVEALGGALQLPYGERTIDYTPPFARHK